jgi:hypothetical protein
MEVKSSEICTMIFIMSLRIGLTFRNSLGTAGGAAGDPMFWPATRHRFGWFLEPAFDYSFARDHQKSIGMRAGLLIAITR